MVVVGLVNDVRVGDKTIEINGWGTRSSHLKKARSCCNLEDDQHACSMTSYQRPEDPRLRIVDKVNREMT